MREPKPGEIGIADKRSYTGTRKLTAAERRAIRDAVHALPPLTDEDINALCEVLTSSRERRGRRNKLS